MSSAEGSYIGFAEQTAKGTTQATDNLFRYLLFTEGLVAPRNVIIPLDREVGGGALPRGMAKVGVVSAGQMAIIPRPATLGLFLKGALGGVASVANGSAYDHTFTLPTDQFDAPYFTVRSAPGGLWGEVFPDVRFNALSLEWRGANFLRGAVGLQGAGVPVPNVIRTTWAETTYVDSGPQFLTPLATIELPTGSPVKVLGGAFVAGMDIPLDEQWITGSYSPDAMDITGRTFMLTLNVKVTDRTLYEKMNYDPAQGAAWAAEIFKEGDILLNFKSDQEADTGTPYELKIEANGQSGDDANVFWSAQLNGLRAGRQVTMTLQGLFAASPNASYEPITATLTNDVADYDTP